MATRCCSTRCQDRSFSACGSGGSCCACLLCGAACGSSLLGLWLGLSVEAAAVACCDGLSSWVDAGILLWLKSCVCIKGDGSLSSVGGICLLSEEELGWGRLIRWFARRVVLQLAAWLSVVAAWLVCLVLPLLVVCGAVVLCQRKRPVLEWCLWLYAVRLGCCRFGVL